MFFTKFDPLTPEYVEEQAKVVGPAAGDSCPCLKGMKFTVKLEGQFAPKKLAYEINYLTEGYYVLVKFTSGPEFPAELDRILGITDGVIRSLVTLRCE